jgi:hypothetical protein
MGTLHCIRHPEYVGEGSPVLSCKTCCSTFIAAIKVKAAAQRPQQSEQDINEWLEQKVREAREYNPRKK